MAVLELFNRAVPLDFMVYYLLEVGVHNLPGDEKNVSEDLELGPGVLRNIIEGRGRLRDGNMVEAALELLLSEKAEAYI